MNSNLPDDVIEWAGGLEKSVGNGSTHHDLAAAFKEAAGSLEVDDPRKAAAEFERLIFDLYLPDDPSDGEFGPLAPMLVTDTGTYPPPVEAFPDEAIVYYRRRLDSLSVPAARARYRDVLWLRQKDHVDGREAMEAYFEAASALSVDGVPGMVRNQYVRRAVGLARTFKAITPEHREQIATYAEELLLADGPGYLCRLIEFAGDLLAEDADRCRRLRDVLGERVNRYANAGGSERHYERSYLTASQRLDHALGNPNTAKRMAEETARSVEREAEERQGEGELVRMALLQQALAEYAKLGMTADTVRVKRLLNEATRLAEGELKSVKTGQTIPRETIERELDSLLEAAEGHGAHAWLVSLSLQSGLWPDWTEVERQTDVTKRDFPLRYLFAGIALGPDGQPMPRPEDGSPEQKLYDEAATYRMRVQIALQFCAIRISILKERGLWDVEHLVGALEQSPLFDDAMPLLRIGVQDFEEGRDWQALHVLLPQIERALRELARGLGMDIFRYERGTKRLRYPALDQILAYDDVRQFLDTIAPSFAMELELLLLNPAGFNLRNNVAHGIISPTVEPFGLAVLVVMILLALCAVGRGKGEASTSGAEEPGA